jgi:hypothetical protein
MNQRPSQHTRTARIEQHTTAPADLDVLRDFLTRAEEDASARAGDFFGGTPLTAAFADAEWQLIATLRTLVTTDADVRAFVRHWRARVETASADDSPQRGPTLSRTENATGAIGAQRLRSGVTLWDAFMRDEIVERYRTLGIVVKE